MKYASEEALCKDESEGYPAFPYLLSLRCPLRPCGLFRTVSKVFGYILPIGKYGLILAFLHSCTHELECDILREANQTMGINKPAIQLDKILVTLVKEAGAYMRNEDEIERAQFH